MEPPYPRAPKPTTAWAKDTGADLAKTNVNGGAIAIVVPRGFMSVALIDDGAWIKASVYRKVLRVILGNPLIAIKMLPHDVTPGLFAPVEMLLVDEGEDRSGLAYVKPSSLMVIEPNAELLSAA
jgi:hypothetical protein